MILSVSRRTNIPAFYSDWFIKRLESGYLLVRNPFNKKQISKISLSPSVVDCIVFWTKNPLPLIDRLKEIDRLKYNYYFQFTVTSYDTNIERNVPPKSEIIKYFRPVRLGISPFLCRQFKFKIPVFKPPFMFFISFKGCH